MKVIFRKKRATLGCIFKSLWQILHGFFLVPWGRKSVVVTGEFSLSCFFNGEFLKQYSSSADCTAPFPLLSEVLHLRIYPVCLCGN